MALTGAAAFGTAFVAACMPGQSGGAGPANTAVEAGTITFADWNVPGGAERTQRLVDRFQTQHPGTKIDVVSWDYNLYLDNLQISYASDTGPDVVDLDMPIVQKYDKMGAFIDQRPLAKADKQITLSNWSPLALETMTGKKSNRLVAIPAAAGPNIVYYNRTLIDAAGKQSPLSFYKSDTWTWDAYLDIAQATTKRTDTGDWTVAGCVPGLERCWVGANGGAEFDDPRAPTRCLYDTPQAIDALTFLGELRTRYQVTPVDFKVAFGMNDINGFENAKVALNTRWPPPISQYVKDKVAFTWGLMPYPKGKGGNAMMTFDIGTAGNAIAKTAKLQGLAWAWAKFTIDDQGQIEAAQESNGSGAPFNRAAQESIIKILQSVPNIETPEITIELVRKPKGGVVRLLSIDQSDINKIMDEELGKLYNGTNSAPVAAREIAARVNKYLQEHPQ
jgi:multiple sugar transport system substrate-binding protein